MDYYKLFNINDDGDCEKCEGVEEGYEEEPGIGQYRTFYCKIFEKEIEFGRVDGYLKTIPCRDCKSVLRSYKIGVCKRQVLY